MKSLLGSLCLMLICSMGHAQQPQQTPEERQKTQETLDAYERLADAVEGLQKSTNAIVKEIKKQCVVTGVSETRCECLANNIPFGIGQDKELWGDGSKTAWVAYVSLITLPMPESEILAKIKTAGAKTIIQTAFKARYKCSP